MEHNDINLQIMNNILLISEDYIKTNSGLNDNIWGDYLLPAIRETQDIGLQSIIGSALYGSILSKVADGTIRDEENAAYKALLDDHIQVYLMYGTIVSLIPLIGVKLANLGTVISNDEHITNLSQGERDLVSSRYTHLADFYARRMQEWLLANSEDFPELDECACDTMRANLKSAATTGLWLGGIRGKRIIG